MQNFIELKIKKKKLDPKTGKPSFWCLKTNFEQFGSKLQKSLKKAISPEPEFCFSQIRPHFNHNFEMNPINLSKVIICLHLEALGLIICFESIWPKRLTKT